MILAAVVALSLAAPEKSTPPSNRHGDHLRESRRLGGRSGAPAPPLFRFAPSTGAGMTEECACTNPTGTKGETLTFTRASAATCTKGNVLTGIDDGDLVYCTDDQPRVMRGGDGSGAKGLMVEVARTNVVLRSQEMDNASWGNTGTPPTIRADHGIAPDGTQTAEAIQFHAVGGGGESGKYQSGLGVVGTGTCSMYLKGAPPAAGGPATSGSIDLATGAAANPCTTCTYTADSWTRCVLSGAVSTYIFLGNESAGACAGGARTEQNVYVWGVQCEAGTYVSAYIPTTNATATRAIETASFTVGPKSTSPSTSLRASWVSPGVQSTSGTAESGPVCIQQDATNNLRSRVLSQTAPNMRPSCGVNTTGQSAAITYGSNVSMSAGLQQWACSWNQATTTKSLFFNNVSTSNATQTAATAFTWDTLKLQGDCPDTFFGATVSRPNGVVSDVCLDTSLTRCTQTQ